MNEIRTQRLTEAIDQAKRFIRCAEYAIHRQALQRKALKSDYCRDGLSFAEARRQSMTLTRKLAVLRSSEYSETKDRP